MTLIFWSWPGSIDGIAKLAVQFHQKNPTVTIHTEELPWNTVLQKFTAAMATGGVGAPDISGAGQPWVRSVIGKNGGLLDLTGHMHRAHATHNFLPFKIKQASTPDGHIWAVPWDSGPVANVYRHDLLSKYSLKPSDMDTWQGYIDAAASIKEQSGGKVRMMALAVNPVGFQQMLAWEFGGGIYDAKGDVIVDQQPNIDALNIAKELWDRDLVWKNLTPAATHAATKNGTVVSFIQAEWANKTIETVAPETKGLWAIRPMPALKKGANTSANAGGAFLVINRATKYPDEAWSFLAFAQMTVHGQMLQYEDLKTGLFPTWIPCYKQAIFKEPRPFQAGAAALREDRGSDTTLLPSEELGAR